MLSFFEPYIPLGEKHPRGSSASGGIYRKQARKQGEYFPILLKRRLENFPRKEKCLRSFSYCTCALDCVKPYLLFLSRVLIPTRERQTDRQTDRPSHRDLLQSPFKIPQESAEKCPHHLYLLVQEGGRKRRRSSSSGSDPKNFVKAQ